MLYKKFQLKRRYVKFFFYFYQPSCEHKKMFFFLFNTENLGAFSSHDLGRHIHRFGGPPTGSFIVADKSVLQPSVAPALFMDITHDNEPLMRVGNSFI